MTNVVVRETLGETFMLVHDVDGVVDLTPERVRALASGHAGLIRVVRSDATAEGTSALHADPPARWFFDYWLPDGHRGTLSGNGLRIYTRYLLDEGLVSVSDRRETIAIGTRAGVRDVLCGVAGVAVDLGRWRFLSADNELFRLSLSGVQITVSRSDDAEPDDIDPEADLTVLVPFHAVETAHGIAQTSARAIKTIETPSSGLGAAAAAVALRYWHSGAHLHHWRVAMSGGDLGVRMFPTEDGEHLSVSGP